MGSGASVEHPQWMEYQEMARRSREIDDMLTQAFKAEKKIIKVLLLGAAECGKSTILKQIRILHLNGFDDGDFIGYKRLIYFNVMEAITQLLNGMEQLKIPFKNSANNELRSLVKRFHDFLRDAKVVTSLDPNVADAVDQIWHDPNAQICYDRRNEFYLYESAKYFLDKLEQLAACDYKPTIDDILRSRVETVGCVEIDFSHKGESFRLIDVGGHRSQRKKWINFFDNVTAIMFIASLAEYDQVLLEDSKMNRLQESIRVYKSIANNMLFEKTAIMVFLNKLDVFEEKIVERKIPLSICYPKFTGNKTLEECKEKVKHEFEKRSPSTKQIYMYFTTATDTRNVDRVFNACAEIVIAKNLSTTGLQC